MIYDGRPTVFVVKSKDAGAGYLRDSGPGWSAKTLVWQLAQKLSIPAEIMRPEYNTTIRGTYTYVAIGYVIPLEDEE